MFTSFEANVVVDLLPIPFRRALNFLFVAFIADIGSGDLLETSGVVKDVRIQDAAMLLVKVKEAVEAVLELTEWTCHPCTRNHIVTKGGQNLCLACSDL